MAEVAGAAAAAYGLERGFGGEDIGLVGGQGDFVEVAVGVGMVADFDAGAGPDGEDALEFGGAHLEGAAGIDEGGGGSALESGDEFAGHGLDAGEVAAARVVAAAGDVVESEGNRARGFRRHRRRGAQVTKPLRVSELAIASILL